MKGWRDEIKQEERQRGKGKKRKSQFYFQTTETGRHSQAKDERRHVLPPTQETEPPVNQHNQQRRWELMSKCWNTGRHDGSEACEQGTLKPPHPNPPHSDLTAPEG